MYNNPLHIADRMAQEARHSADLAALSNKGCAYSGPTLAKAEARNILKEVYLQKNIYEAVIKRFKKAHPEHETELNQLESKVKEDHAKNTEYQEGVTTWIASKI